MLVLSELVVVKRRENLQIMPFWRGVFSIIYCVPLFKRYLRRQGKKDFRAYAEDMNGLAFILLQVLVNASNRFGGVVSDLGFIAFWLVLIPFLRMQKQIDFINSRLVTSISISRNPNFLGLK